MTANPYSGLVMHYDYRRENTYVAQPFSYFGED